MAPSAHQIAGAVLEEAVLSILHPAGFTALDLNNIRDDPTIDPAKPPITIHGRGTDHQIDAVADPVFAYPFSNPVRLLIEAKAYSINKRVGLDIVRNAVGTLKDLSEFWSPRTNDGGRVRRYNYRYAIFASTEFTKGAQEYAFAQDIYLLPLRGSAFFLPVVDAIDQLREYFKEDPQRWKVGWTLSSYRRRLHNALKQDNQTNPDELKDIVDGVSRVRVGLIAIADRQFPIFLVPRNPDVIYGLNESEVVQIFYDKNGWYLRRPSETENLFSFDLPIELFKIYATRSGLNSIQALHLKAERLGQLQAFLLKEGRVQLIQFKLDKDWIEKLLKNI